MVDKRIKDYKVGDEVKIVYYVTDTQTTEHYGKITRIMDKALVIENVFSTIIYFDDIISVSGVNYA